MPRSIARGLVGLLMLALRVLDVFLVRLALLLLPPLRFFDLCCDDDGNRAVGCSREGRAPGVVVLIPPLVCEVDPDDPDR